MLTIGRLRRYAVTLFVCLAIVPSLVHPQQLPAVSDPSARAKESLAQIIKREQSAKVRESWGEKASECFTEIDLEAFRRNRVPDAVVASLRKDIAFARLVTSMRALGPEQRQDVLSAGAKIYKPTWAQLGKIDRRGQTDAGQAAERELANAIVSTVQDMLRAETAK